MKKLIWALVLLPTLAFAQTKGFIITGKIEGLTDGPVRITSTQDANNVIVAGESRGGVFTLKGVLTEPGLYWLAMGKEQPVYLYLENSPIQIKGNRKDLKTIKIEGSASQNDFNAFQNTFNPLIGELNAAAAQLQQPGNQNNYTVLRGKYDSLVLLIQNKVGSFVKERSNSYVSPFVLGVTAQLFTNPSQLESNFNLLSEPVKNSQIGKSLSDFIAYSKVGSIGSTAMEFSQADTQGKAVSLSSFRGKYVLIDFWASWCKPCRAENPNVVKAYNKFHDKNFTVLGVSLDQEKNAWIKAIEKDQLTWTHVSDLQQWNNAVAQLYRVQSIPQNYLIDPNGKIVAKDLHGAELERKLCELLGCN